MKNLRIIILASLAVLFAFTSCVKTEEEKKVEKVTVSPSEAVLAIGETEQLSAEVVPADAIDAVVTWSSSNNEIVTVDETGLVTAVAEGEAEVYAQAGGVRSSACKVTVEPGEPVTVPVESVTLSEESLNLLIGDEVELTVEILPEDAEYDGIVWSSSDEAVATVTEGLVKAIAEGNAEITVTAGGVSDVCEVTVTAPAIPVESVTLSEESLDLLVGDQVELTVEILPEDAEYDKVVWSSSDEAVVTVADGLVTAIAEGSAEVTVTVGGVSDVCAVTVSVPAPPAVGDIFYSDGTYSTELDPNKTPIGMVFYVYDPLADDAALARDFPECTHGLVFSLTEAADGVAWQENYNAYGALVSTWIEENLTDYTPISSNGFTDENLNSILGYNNTKAIEAFNAANPDYPVTVVDIVKDFAESVPAPENTSGWYLPSVKELSLICTGYYSASIGNLYGHTEQMDALNEILKTIEGADILFGIYASSTEMLSYPTMTLGLNMLSGDGSVYWNLKTDLNNVVRPVLAF